MRPGIASGPHSRLLASRSIWRLPFRLGGGQGPSRVPHRVHCCPLCEASRLPIVALARFDRSFAATFPVVQKDRQSSIAPLHRRPIPFLASRDRLRSHRPGADRWFEPKPKPNTRTAAPYSRAKDQDRFSTAVRSRLNLAEATSRVSPCGRLRSCPCDPFSPHSKPVFPRSEDRVRSVGAP